MILFLIAFMPVRGLESAIRGHATTVHGSELICHDVWKAPLSTASATLLLGLSLAFLVLVAVPSTRVEYVDDSHRAGRSFSRALTAFRRVLVVGLTLLVVTATLSHIETEAAVDREMAACLADQRREPPRPDPVPAIVSAMAAHPDADVAVVEVQAIEVKPDVGSGTSARQLTWTLYRTVRGAKRELPPQVRVADDEARFDSPGTYVVFYSLAPTGKVAPALARFADVFQVEGRSAKQIAEALVLLDRAPSREPPCACLRGDPLCACP